MTIHPIPKELFDKLKMAGVIKVNLNWSGGSDEGYLYVHLDYDKEGNYPEVSGLDEDVQSWGDETWCYNGAGDGHDYGDDLVYDLRTMECTHSDWYMERQDNEDTVYKFEKEEPEPEPEPDPVKASIQGLMNSLIEREPSRIDAAAHFKHRFTSVRDSLVEDVCEELDVVGGYSEEIEEAVVQMMNTFIGQTGLTPPIDVS